MEFALDNGKATYQIQGYQEGRITVNNQTYINSLIVMPEWLLAPWQVEALEDLVSNHFDVLLPHHPQLVILGTGKTSCFPHPQVFSALIDHKIGFEIMSTSAACRTYTLLMAEGRNVAAALFC